MYTHIRHCFSLPCVATLTLPAASDSKLKEVVDQVIAIT
jgi:hypothetical protein